MDAPVGVLARTPAVSAAGLDAAGNVIAWRHRIAYPSITSTFKPDADRPSVGELNLGIAVARGAFEAGVIRALADADVKIVRIIASSAGALNGVVLASSVRSQNLRAGAAALHALWRDHATWSEVRWTARSAPRSMRRHGLLHERTLDDLDAIGILEREEILERCESNGGRRSPLPSPSARVCASTGLVGRGGPADAGRSSGAFDTPEEP